MKTFSSVVTVLALFFATSLVLSQDLQNSDFYVLKDGRLYLSKKGENVAMEKEVTLPDGSKLMTNGVVVLKNGQEKKLPPNQRLTTDGYLLSGNGQLIRWEDHLTVRKGKLVMVKDGQAQELTQPTTLTDGTRVTIDGLVQQPDGKRFRLHDGQMLKLEGGILPGKDHVMFKDGRVILQKDGALIKLEPGRTISMSDGTKVMGDGTVIRPGGARLTLKEGQRLDLQGAVAARPR